MNEPETGALVQAFLEQFYKKFDEDKRSIVFFYHPEAYLTFQDHKARGHLAIENLLTNDVKFQKIAHSVTNLDYQLISADRIVICVQGSCKSDEDMPMVYSETIILKNEGGGWYICNHVFRLSLHDG